MKTLLLILMLITIGAYSATRPTKQEQAAEKGFSRICQRNLTACRARVAYLEEVLRQKNILTEWEVKDE